MASYRNLADMFFQCAAARAGRPRCRVKRAGTWRDIGWNETATAVRETAAGLIDLGVRPRDTVALLSGTRPEWLEADLGIYAAGGVTVPIYQSSVAPECGYILTNSGSRVVFVEDATQLEKLRTLQREGFVLDGERAPVEPRQAILIDGEAEGEGVVSLAELRARGREALARGTARVDRHVAEVGRDDLATIVYTSGTTGPPKGVLQTHGNHLAGLEAVAATGMAREGEVDFLFLPLAHSLARMLGYFGIWAGTVTAFASSVEAVAQEIAETRPQVIPSVPRIYEKIYGRIQSAREDAALPRRLLLDWAVGVGRARSACEQRREAVPWLLAMQALVADTLVFSRIRALLGGRVRLMVSGGAPLARDIIEFFHAIGLLVLEGYGLTETTPILTCNVPDAYRIGTVGRAVRGVELRIASDGEILARGPNVAQGYHQRPDATRESWDGEGWFHTGDVGELDADGFLRITDRKKDLIKTSGGKYVAPQNIENLLKTQPHVSQAIVVGDNRKYCVALLTLDLDEVRRFAAARQIACDDPAELARHPDVVALVDAEVQAVNAQLASWETIKSFRIVQRDFSPEGGELTPSLKVKRKVVADRYRSLLDEMYA